MTWLKTSKDGVVISIHLSPRASRDAIDGLHGDALNVKIKAPPVDGKANLYLVKFLADRLSIARRNVTLIRGETSREKRVLITGLTENDIAVKLSRRWQRL